jgi:hypothetical protein
MTLKDLINELRPRAQRLGLGDPVTGFVDDSELSTYLVESMKFLANKYQLQHFLRINRQLFTTSANVEQYDIPDNYGFWSPEETYRSGLAVTNTDGTQTTNLMYYDPARFNLVRTPGLTSKPSWFTVTQGLIYLAPIPDQAYIIEAIERQVQDGTDIPVPYAEAIKIEALVKLASDAGKITPLLLKEHTDLLMPLVNSESRFRQRFYTSRERIGSGRYRRYGR